MIQNPMQAVRKMKMDLNYGQHGYIVRVIAIGPVPVSAFSSSSLYTLVLINTCVNIILYTMRFRKAANSLDHTIFGRIYRKRFTPF